MMALYIATVIMAIVLFDAMIKGSAAAPKDKAKVTESDKVNSFVDEMVKQHTADLKKAGVRAKPRAETQANRKTYAEQKAAAEKKRQNKRK